MLTLIFLVGALMFLSSCTSSSASHSSTGASQSMQTVNSENSQENQRIPNNRKGLVTQKNNFNNEESTERVESDMPQKDQPISDNPNQKEVEDIDEIIIDEEENLSQGIPSYGDIPFELIFSNKEGMDFNLLEKAFISYPFYNRAEKVSTLNLAFLNQGLRFNASSFVKDGFFFENTMSINSQNFDFNLGASYIKENNSNLLGRENVFHDFSRESYILNTNLKLNLDDGFYTILNHSVKKAYLRGSLSNFSRFKIDSMENKVSFYIGLNNDQRRIIAGIATDERDSYKAKMMIYSKISSNLSTIFSVVKNGNDHTFLFGLSSSTY